MTAIKAIGLTKKYGAVCAVDGLELEIQRGELVALLGVNGAGKTTTIEMLCALKAPTGGDAVLLGRSICRQPEQVKEIIGVSPQQTAVASNLTVEENLRLMAGVHGLDKKAGRERVDDMLGQFHLTAQKDRRAKTLSGGYQRRLSIAMALVSSPQILFLDEPTLGLDILARREMWNLVRQLKGKVTVMLTTHYLEEAESLADRICVMQSGKVRAFDTLQGLLTQTRTDNLEDAFISLTQEGAR